MKVYRIEKIEFPNKAGRLANGLRVVIQPDDSQPHVRVVLRYDVGAAHDPKDKKGIAHLLEHLAFRLGDELIDVDSPEATGAAKKPKAKPAAGDKKGKKTKFRRIKYIVSDNAYTTLDETVYWKQVVPAHLDDVLEDLAEQMGDFTPKITEDVFAAEREVVHNERRSSYEGKPFDRAVLDRFEKLYPPEHPYQGSAVIGSHETIANIEMKDVAEYLEKHYHPANATIAIVGPVDPRKTLAMVMKHFGGKPKRAPSTLKATPWTPSYREETVIVPTAKETMITVVWPLGPQYSDETTAIRMLNEAIGGWFYHRLVTNRGYAYWVHSFVRENALESQFVVSALLRHHDDLDAAKNKILEIAGLLNSAVRKEWLARARRRMVYRKVYGAERAGERAEKMAEYYSLFGHPMSWVKEIEQINGVNYSKAVRLGSTALDRDRAFVLIHTPVESDSQDRPKDQGGDNPSYTAEDAKKASGGLEHDNRDVLPRKYEFTQNFDDYKAWAIGAAGRWSNVEDFTLDNGIRCRVVQNGSLPVMFVHGRFSGGRLAEPADKHGVAKVMLDSLGLSGRANREHRYRIGQHYWWSVRSEWLSYGTKFLSVYADKGLDLMAESLASSPFLRRSVLNSRDNIIRNLGDAERDISSLATRAYWKARGLADVYPVETKSTLRGLGRGNVTDYHEHVIYPENLILTVVSDRPKAYVRALVEKHFGGWSAADKAPLSAETLSPTPESPASGSIVIVPVSGTAQSQVLVGFDTPGWLDWKQQVLSEAVALLLKTKLRRLRAAMGVTYGTRVNTWTYRNVGSIMIRTKVDRKSTDKAFRKLLEVVDSLRHEPVTTGELDYIRRSLISRYTGAGGTNKSMAETHGGFIRRDRPADYYEQVVGWLTELKVDDLQAALDARLGQPGTLVVSGSPPKIPKVRQGVLAGFKGPLVHYSPAELLD